MDIFDIEDILESNEEFGEWMSYEDGKTIFCLEETNWRYLYINNSIVRCYGDVTIDEEKETITVKTENGYGFGMSTLIDITIKAEDIDDFEVSGE